MLIMDYLVTVCIFLLGLFVGISWTGHKSKIVINKLAKKLKEREETLNNEWKDKLEEVSEDLIKRAESQNL
jgi:cell division protein FtsL